MINKVKGIDIKNHAYQFFNDIVNIKNFDPNEIKINEKSYKKCNDQRFKICKK